MRKSLFFINIIIINLVLILIILFNKEPRI